jgi:hypothetical protein
VNLGAQSSSGTPQSLGLAPPSHKLLVDVL